LTFRALDKLLHVYFYTSNVDKYLHLKTILDRYGLSLRYFRSRTEAYPEDYSGSTEDLLRRSCQAVRELVGPDKLCFVEDTSIRIEALSTPNHDAPGLEAKEWFDRTSFEELDQGLRARGNNRAAVVKSDIALSIPGLDRPIFFHGETSGRIADAPPDFRGSHIYPWLTPGSFNGWFIPDGASRALGAMSFEESLPYDFRARAAVQLVDRLEEHACVLNLSPAAYGVTLRRRPDVRQLPLISAGSPARQSLIVLGRTCAGKTTFAEFGEQRYGLAFVEASGIVRSFWQSESRGEEKVAEFAQRLFEESGPDFVAREILDRYSDKLRGPFVISGFRLLEEIETIREAIPDVVVILIEAAERTRFARDLARGGRGSEKHGPTFEDFLKDDEAQWKFGLLRVARDIADITVMNEGTLEQYHDQIEAIIAGDDERIQGVIHRRKIPDPQRSELFRCLQALAEVNRPLNCREVASAIMPADHGIRPNNVNKALKAVPELARRLERGRRIRYVITDAGKTYIRLLAAKSQAR